MANKPKATKRYCPICNKRTDQKVKAMKTGIKGGNMKRGSLVRAALRNTYGGLGNQGRRSRQAVSKFKRKTKTTKKTVFIYTCAVCGKSKNAKKGIRSGKIVIE
jgi:ribosomal protein L44E